MKVRGSEVQDLEAWGSQAWGLEPHARISDMEWQVMKVDRCRFRRSGGFDLPFDQERDAIELGVYRLGYDWSGGGQTPLGSTGD